MIAKIFEVRDRATFIPALVVKLDPTDEAERYLLARAGYGRTPAEQSRYIMFWSLTGGADEATTDPHKHHRGRTRQIAHEYLLTRFDELTTGAVIDVEFILGERATPKISERKEAHP